MDFFSTKNRLWSQIQYLFSLPSSQFLSQSKDMSLYDWKLLWLITRRNIQRKTKITEVGKVCCFVNFTNTWKLLFHLEAWTPLLRQSLGVWSTFCHLYSWSKFSVPLTLAPALRRRISWWFIPPEGLLTSLYTQRVLGRIGRKVNNQISLPENF